MNKDKKDELAKLSLKPINELGEYSYVKVTYPDGFIRRFDFYLWAIHRARIYNNLYKKGLVTIKPIKKFKYKIKDLLKCFGRK